MKRGQTLLHTPVWSLSLSLSLSHSPTPFILRVPLDPAGAGPQQEVPELGPKGKPLIVQFSGWLGPHQGITPPSPT